MKYTKTDKGYTIGDKLFLGDEADSKRITLKTTKGPIMQYGDHMTNVVEFPGEYDIQGVGVECHEAGDLLHFIVRIDGQTVAVIQSKAIFDLTNFEAIDHWLLADGDIKDEIENLELDGEITILE